MKAYVRILLAATYLVSGAGAWGASAQGGAQAKDGGKTSDEGKVSGGGKASGGGAAEPAAPSVTIKGKKKDRSDREIYDVTKNPDAKTGTAADALNKIPGVNVDPSGNVTLHGRNVVIYLNGRPSLMLSGDNRGVALKSMPSAYLSTIEVISSPGAQYASSGGAPVININTQRNMPPGVFGSVGARYSTPAGGFDSAFVGLSSDKLSLTLIGSYFANRLDARYGGQTTAYANGAVTQASDSSGSGRSAFHGVFLSANLQYDAGLNDVLAAAVNYNRSPSTFDSFSRSTDVEPGGAVINSLDQSGQGHFVNESEGLSASYTHYGNKPDETLKLDASLARSLSRGNTDGTVTYLVSAIPANSGTRFRANAQQNDKRQSNLHAEYNTPLGDDQLTLGGELEMEDNRTGVTVAGPGTDAASLVVNPLLSDDFRSHQVTSAVYATLQREVTARWTVLAGVRAEAVRLTSDDVTYGTRGTSSYARLNPSLFATYVFSPTEKLRLNYTHRQQRPEAADLNPHVVYASDTAVNSGNPSLKPQENDSVEARYEFQGKTVTWAAGGFWRKDRHSIATVSQVIPDPQGLGNIVTQSTRVNGAGQGAAGFTGNISKPFSKSLTVNADLTVTLSERRNPQIDGVRRGTSADGSVSVSYNFPKGDRIFAMYKVAGKSLTSQGYTTGSGQASLQYSHKLTPKIDLDLSVDDLFRQTKTATVIDTPVIKGRFVSSRQAPTFMIGLSRHFMRFGPPKAAN